MSNEESIIFYAFRYALGRHSFDPSGLFKKSIVPLAAAKAAGFKPSDL